MVSTIGDLCVITQNVSVKTALAIRANARKKIHADVIRKELCQEMR